MRKKTLLVFGLLVAFFIVQGCVTKPEKGLLKRYFDAVRFSDNQTMASIALEPFQPEMVSWEMVSVSPETIEPAKLPQLSKAEIEAKKIQDEQIGPTIDADALLKNSQDDRDLTRTAAGKAAAQRKVDELQAKYDVEYAKMQEFKIAYTAAKAAAASEETMTMFSLGVRELANVRELVGDVHSKNVEVAIKTTAGATKRYRLLMKQYLLRDEAAGVPRRGRWVIIKFEPLG